jgi:hypothetical protein
MVWGAMTAAGPSKIHVLPPNQTVTAKYYQENIFSPFLLDDINRAGDTGSVTERRFHENMLELNLQQSGASAHTAKETQQWLRNNFPRFWNKDTWPPNSPDLSPIEFYGEFLKTEWKCQNLTQEIFKNLRPLWKLAGKWEAQKPWET